MLEVKNIQKVYGETIKYEALKEINFTVNDGEFVGIMGPSGSGKSTLLNLLATIDSPTSGEIMLDGKNPHQLNQEEIAKFRRTELGFIFQSFNLMPTLTVEENIAYGLKMNKVNKADIVKQVKYYLELVGLAGHEKKYPHELSAG